MQWVPDIGGKLDLRVICDVLRIPQLSENGFGFGLPAEGLMNDLNEVNYNTWRLRSELTVSRADNITQRSCGSELVQEAGIDKCDKAIFGLALASIQAALDDAGCW